MKLSMLMLLLAGVVGCHHATATDAGAVEAGPPAAELPAPFESIRLGMTEAEVTALFPPTEDLHKCKTGLVGGFEPLPPTVPGSENKPSSHCARGEIGGSTIKELAAMIVRTQDGPSAEQATLMSGMVLTLAQLRGAVRAGALDETSVLAADKGESATAYEAAFNDAMGLYDGTVTFIKPRHTRREISAVIADDCSDLDPLRIEKYVAGEYSLAQIDADAHSRVVYGKCRYPYVQHETHLQRMFVARTGALGAIGLSRATQPDHAAKPDDPTTYVTYSSRTGLGAAKAKLGVQLANAMPDTVTFWSGAITLNAGDRGSSPWGAVMVWFRDGTVVRMLAQPLDDDKIGELPTALASVYGKPGTTAGAVTTWSLANGVKARLDIGAGLSLLVQSADAPTVSKREQDLHTSTPAPTATATNTTAKMSPRPNAAAPTATPTTGTLDLGSSRPASPSGGWCMVTIDGAARGKTPLSGIELSAGPHRVVCTGSDGKSDSITITIPAGGNARHNFNL